MRLALSRSSGRPTGQKRKKYVFLGGILGGGVRKGGSAPQIWNPSWEYLLCDICDIKHFFFGNSFRKCGCIKGKIASVKYSIQYLTQNHKEIYILCTYTYVKLVRWYCKYPSQIEREVTRNSKDDTWLLGWVAKAIPWTLYAKHENLTSLHLKPFLYQLLSISCM